MPTRVYRRRRVWVGDELGAFFEHNVGSIVERPTSCLRPRIRHGRPCQRAFADEIRASSCRSSSRGPTSSGVDGAVGFLADDDIAFFGAQNVHGLRAIGRDAMGRAGNIRASHTARP